MILNMVVVVMVVIRSGIWLLSSENIQVEQNPNGPVNRTKYNNQSRNYFHLFKY